MILKRDLVKWINQIKPDEEIWIDEDGLSLCAYDGTHCIEVGGRPEDKSEPDWVCEDCAQAIAYDDFSALDCRYNEKESTRREKQIRAGVYTGNGHWVLGDNAVEQLTIEEEFSKSSCDCCGYNLAGRRHAAHYIEHEES